jgi:hypothetical protein
MLGVARPCDQCGTEFVPVRTIHRFCSEACRQRARHERAHGHHPLIVVELRCDVCAAAPRAGSPVLRFSLKRAIRQVGARRATTKGVGTIFLCRPCWDTTAGRRRRVFGPRYIEVAA